MKTVSKNRLVLIAIALMFFIPLGGAVLMQSDWWDYQPAHTTNRGALLVPAISLDLDLLPVQHEAEVNPGPTPWTLVFPLDDNCSSDCIDAITGLRQIHRASGRHQQELSVALLSREPLAPETQSRLTDIYPEFRLLLASNERVDQVLESAIRASGSSEPGYSGHGFVMDPAGQLILAYPPPLRPTDINKDLKRLFKYSGEDPS